MILLHSVDSHHRNLHQSLVMMMVKQVHMQNSGVGIAQFVEHPTEKPGTVLTQVRVPGAARDFFPRVNFQHRLCKSYSVCTATLRNHMLQHVHVL